MEARPAAAGQGEAWLVKKLAAGAEIFNTLLPCRTDNLLPMGIPQEEGERERVTETGEEEGKEGSFIIKERRNENKGMKTK